MHQIYMQRKKFTQKTFTISILVCSLFLFFGCTDNTPINSNYLAYSMLDGNLGQIAISDGVGALTYIDVNDLNIPSAGSGTDTNWQTSWGVFDANMKATFLPLIGGKMTGDINMNDKAIVRVKDLNLGIPSLPSSAQFNMMGGYKTAGGLSIWQQPSGSNPYWHLSWNNNLTG